MKIFEICNSLYSSKSYLIGLANKTILVDCGDINPIINWLKNNGRQLDLVLLTHVHFDHIYGLNALLKHYSNMIVVTNQIGADCLYSSEKNLGSPVKICVKKFK